MKQLRPYPQVVVSKKAARALKGGHPWVFEGEVRSVEPAPEGGRMPANGDVVDVLEENGTYQGTGLISEKSKIRVRVISRNANDRFDAAFWARKLEWAWAHRKACMGTRALPGCEPDTNCCRLLFSEADAFGGLIVDRYEDVLVAQVGTVGMQRLRPTVYPLLLAILAADGQAVRAIYERNDSPARAKDGLPLEKGFYDFSAPGAVDPAARAWIADHAPAGADALAQVEKSHGADPRVVVRENGILFDLDIENSQKTGFFLDQKYNRRAVRELAAGRRVLDCFCHVGPFGLNAAAGGADFVRCVDVSQTAIDLARENARANALDAAPDGTPRMGFTCRPRPPARRGRPLRLHRARPAGLHQEPPDRAQRQPRLQGDQPRRPAPAAPRRLPRDLQLQPLHDARPAGPRHRRGRPRRERPAPPGRGAPAGARPPHPLGRARDPLPRLLHLPGDLARTRATRNRDNASHHEKAAEKSDRSSRPPS